VADGYITRLVAKNHKLAIAEQMGDSSFQNGLMHREVVRVISPGTVIESEMLDESRNNYLACVFASDQGVGICCCDISTGTAEVTQITGANMYTKLVNELAKYMPTEAILSPAAVQSDKLRAFFNQRCQCLVETYGEEKFVLEDSREEVSRHFGNLCGLDQEEFALRALGTALRYLREAQKSEYSSIRCVESYTESQLMRLDASSRRNLELCETMRNGDKKGSLLWVLDKTRCAMGKRLLRTWLERPLTHLPRITKRQCAVGELVDETNTRLDCLEALSEMLDLERLMSRVVYQSANARDLRAVAASLKLLPALKHALNNAKSEYLCQIGNDIDNLEDVYALINDALVEEPPFSIREGGLVKAGYLAELDELRALQGDGKNCLVAIQLAEQERTGIKKLKIGYNRVFGYYIEVSNAYKMMVPEHYIRKQTLSNCERYITGELKELEAKVLSAGERIVKLEFEVFTQLREELSGHYRKIRKSAGAVAALDVLCSLAEVAVANDYCKPEFTTGDEITINEGRHPVVERVLSGGQPFVSNNTAMNHHDCRCMVITGPNMAGKSTYMRQVALIVLMAQVGSFVSAQSATLGVVDAIFTRVGASDDLASGQSTFMVEMNEVALILNSATPKSLALFDEIGRGTSTFDGMSIARAVLEYAVNTKSLGCKTLFATHYHELTELEAQVPGVQNFSVAVKKRGDEITFLRRILRGAADGSFGVEVAKLAGVPNAVVKRAKVILRELEIAQPAEADVNPIAPNPQQTEIAQDLTFVDVQANLLVDELRAIDADTLTPIEALTKLYELVKKAKET